MRIRSAGHLPNQYHVLEYKARHPFARLFAKSSFIRNTTCLTCTIHPIHKGRGYQHMYFLAQSASFSSCVSIVFLLTLELYEEARQCLPAHPRLISSPESRFS